MLRKLLSTVSIVVASAGLMLAQNESSIKVKLVDKTTKETIPFANVLVEMGGIQAGVGTTNIDGEVMIKPLNPGKYNVKATYVGYQAVEVDNINVAVGKTVYINMDMTAGQQLDVVEVIEYSEPLIDPDTKSGGTVTREEYQNMATKNINSVAATTAGVYQKDEGGSLNVRGARSSGTAYYVDGQKVIGSSNVPQSAVEQITTIVGGTPAEYGDATGGIIAITTRGPASKYTGGVEVISSGFGEKKGLDAYGYNFLGFSINGPILTKKDSSSGAKKSVLGFSISGEGVSEKDPSPSAIGFYEIKKDKLNELTNAPLRPSAQGQGYQLNSEYVTKDDLHKIKARTNVASKAMRLSGKIQFQPSTNMGITVGGSVDYNRKHDFIYQYALYNPVNNPLQTDNTWRVYAKLTQKFNSNTSKEEEKSSSVIKNAYFTLQAGYEKSTSKTEDDSHGDKVFDYGYIGKFNQEIKRTYEYKYDTATATENLYQTSYALTNLTFSPGTQNPTGTPYTSQYYQYNGNAANPSDVQFGLGLLNGDRPANIYGMWYNTGRQYNGYGYNNRSQFRVFANFSADIKNHAIQVGFEYEQRNERAFSLSPIGLWTQMRALANKQISQLDYSDTILNTNPDPAFSFNGVDPRYNYYDFNRKYVAADQSQFDKSLRTKLGYAENGTNWIDIDSYDPSMYSLDMFSADDLLNVGGTQYVSYYGYDHTGKKLGSNPSLDDFYNKKDANGNYTREIGAYKPIYIAGYLQDRFDFKDIKFNVGLRIDRFDANQKVLKDKYLLYETKTAAEMNYTGQAVRPSNIGDDYIVYVNDLHNPNSEIKGYRNGDVWYDASGNVITDPSLLKGSDGGINPALVDDKDATQHKIKSTVFTDYKPQINFMPRIAFAFPISDVANFFAHYDVLTQRPDNNRLDPTGYLLLANANSSLISNAALKPQRTTDYELGFTQVLNEKKNSAITLSAFYRELRDMIQIVKVNYAYPISYSTYDNIDFGTVKGFSIAYDLRRTSGVQLTASYTLQFADGTGSSASDGFNLASNGQPNLRTLHALDFDQRHTVLLNIDYRFGAGKDYKGPVYTHKKGDVEKSVKLMENIGANVVLRAGSGTPYSKQSNYSAEAIFDEQQKRTLQGSINGSNLPWNFKVDLKVDKDVELTWGGKKEGDEKKHANLNIYLQVLNVLNTKNVLAVYRATGNPDDDGYLSSVTGQDAISAKTNPQSFQDLYAVSINNPSNYSRPRVIRLGLLLDF